MRILAIDDRDPEVICRAAATAGIDVEKPQGDLEALLRNLFGTANAAFRKDTAIIDVEGFEQYDMVLLDFGLTTLQFDNFPFRLTAEHIAGYIRALTSVPFVVSLNKLGSMDFDLKYLLGDFGTKADLALHTDLLSNKGLWSGELAEDQFCPWYWPRLNKAAERREAQIQFVRERLDKPILGSLGFPDEAIEQLPLQAIGFLSPQAEDSDPNSQVSVRTVTFWQHFLSSNRTLIRDDRSELLGVLPQDLSEAVIPVEGERAEAVKTIAARVVAGELDFWFRRDILGPQRLLIDAPHLQAKYRFRPGEGDEANPAAWSATAKELTPPYGLAEEFFKAIKAAEFKQSHGGVDLIWTDKPCFWLPQIEDSDTFIELAEKHPKRHNNLVFCEDTRRFVDTKKSTPHRFETALGRGIDVRYIEKLAQLEYSPKSQLAR